MDVRTFRAKSIRDALSLVRSELGPDASVLHTKEVYSGLMRWIAGKQIEVTASANVIVPSRLPQSDTYQSEQSTCDDHLVAPEIDHAASHIPPAHEQDYRAKFRLDLEQQQDDAPTLFDELSQATAKTKAREIPESSFELFTALLDAEFSEDLARDLIAKVYDNLPAEKCQDAAMLKARVSKLIEDEIEACGPIQVQPGQRRLVALVGPTGVGKTTTIAKLAANFHLREKTRVGLITVDTYRIAAVEQLRTYADIIDLPMEVVSTPSEMRSAIGRLSDLDLILMDTAGRSPRDEVKVQELKTILCEADPDEVHLVLSTVSTLPSLQKTAEKFANVGATALILSKLDEAAGLGNVIPLLRDCRLPISYLTNGQNVPDDIEPADSRKLARAVLGFDFVA